MIHSLPLNWSRKNLLPRAHLVLGPCLMMLKISKIFSIGLRKNLVKAIQQWGKIKMFRMTSFSKKSLLTLRIQKWKLSLHRTYHHPLQKYNSKLTVSTKKLLSNILKLHILKISFYLLSGSSTKTINTILKHCKKILIKDQNVNFLEYNLKRTPYFM